MAWVPQKQVIDLTLIVSNLLSYIGTNDADALAWSNGGTALAQFAGLYPNATGRLSTLFPQIIVLDQEHLSEESETEEGDVLVVKLALTLEIALTGPNADTLVLTTKKYAMALESMLANIPAATLTAGSLVQTHASLTRLQTAFDQVQGAAKNASSWLQIFQTRVEYQLITPAF